MTENELQQLATWPTFYRPMNDHSWFKSSDFEPLVVKAAASIRAEASSRAMFVARLENEAAQGRTTISVVDVMALLNDCDYCASMEKPTTPLK